MTIYDFLFYTGLIFIFGSLALYLCGKINIKTHFGWYSIACVEFLIENIHTRRGRYRLADWFTDLGHLELVEQGRR